MSPKVIYYYQTLNGLQGLLDNGYATQINLSAIHFGQDSQNNPYIHINDHTPDDPIYNNLWKELQQALSQNIKICIMLGGAGGAFQTLFSDFDSYYPLLYQLIKNKTMITGIDLDVEELVKLSDIKMLIRRLKADFGLGFQITMAPIAYSMESDNPGMGGFIYKDLFHSPEGSQIDYFNVQCYNSYSKELYDDIINNGYPPNKIIMGMIYGQNINNIICELEKIKHAYPNFLGVFIWEYFQAPPGAPQHPEVWGQIMKNILQ